MNENELFMLHSELWKEGHALYIALLDPSKLDAPTQGRFADWIDRCLSFLRSGSTNAAHVSEMERRAVTLRTEVLKNVALARARGVSLSEEKISEIAKYPDAFRYRFGSGPEFEFHFDCFSWNIPDWGLHLDFLNERPALQLLEIGSFEGFSSCWLAETLLKDPRSRLTCVDLFSGPSAEVFARNIARTGKASQVLIRKGASQEILRQLPLKHYDFIYVDGSHVCSDVLEDLVLSWRLLKHEGIMIIDDYLFPSFMSGSPSLKSVVDFFIECYGSEFLPYSLPAGKQVVFRKYPRHPGQTALSDSSPSGLLGFFRRFCSR